MRSIKRKAGYFLFVALLSGILLHAADNKKELNRKMEKKEVIKPAKEKEFELLAGLIIL